MTSLRQPFSNYRGERLSLLDMPTEVRYMIWDYVFGVGTSNEGTTIDVGSDEVSSERAVDCPVRPFAVDFAYNNLSILSTNKSIHDEAKQIFWSKTTFVFRCTRDLPSNALLCPAAVLSPTLQTFNMGRVLTRLANGDNIVSLVIQHGDKWPCWCERCLDVQEVFDVEWEEQWAERMAQEERMKELEEKHEDDLEDTLAENEEAIRGLEHMFAEE